MEWNIGLRSTTTSKGKVCSIRSNNLLRAALQEAPTPDSCRVLKTYHNLLNGDSRKNRTNPNHQTTTQHTVPCSYNMNIRCPKCEGFTVGYSHSTSIIQCKWCKDILAVPRPQRKVRMYPGCVFSIRYTQGLVSSSRSAKHDNKTKKGVQFKSPDPSNTDDKKGHNLSKHQLANANRKKQAKRRAC